MKFADVSVRTRLLATIVTLGAAMLVVGGVGLRALKVMNDTIISTIDDQRMPVKWIADINAMSERNLIVLDEALIHGDAHTAEQLRQTFTESSATSDELWVKYSATNMAADETEVAKTYWAALTTYSTIRNKVLDALVDGQLEQARGMRSGELMDAFTAQQKPLEALLNIQNREAEEGRQSSLKHYALAKEIGIAAILSGLGIAIVLSVLLLRSILKALGQAVYVSEQISGGALNNHIVIESNDEFGRLLRALQSMDGTLCKIVGEVRDSAATVGNAARELSTGKSTGCQCARAGRSRKQCG